MNLTDDPSTNSTDGGRTMNLTDDAANPTDDTLETVWSLWSSSRPLNDTFYVVGVLFAAAVLLNFVLGVVRMLRLYLWPRIVSGKDLVAMYGKWAVVTGGSDGIGKGYAMELAKRGMNLFILSNRENNIVSEIRNKYPNVEVRYFDVDFSSPDVYEHIEKELSSLDDIGILINNVGMVQAKWQPLEEQNRGFLKTIMNVNMTAMVCVTEMVLKDMILKNKGLIVNMSSVSSLCPLPYATMYSASKGFVDNYSICLAAELRHTKIRVKNLQPLFIRTQLLKGMGQMTDFFDRHFLTRVAFPTVGQFTSSVAATLAYSTPVMLTGYWIHELALAFIPLSILGKERIANINRAVTLWIARK